MLMRFNFQQDMERTRRGTSGRCQRVEVAAVGLMLDLGWTVFGLIISACWTDRVSRWRLNGLVVVNSPTSIHTTNIATT